MNTHVNMNSKTHTPKRSKFPKAANKIKEWKEKEKDPNIARNSQTCIQISNIYTILTDTGFIHTLVR